MYGKLFVSRVDRFILSNIYREKIVRKYHIHVLYTRIEIVRLRLLIVAPGGLHKTEIECSRTKAKLSLS